MLDGILNRLAGRRRVPEPLRSLLIEARTRRPYPRAMVCGCGAHVLLTDRHCPGCGHDTSRCAPLRRIA